MAVTAGPPPETGSHGVLRDVEERVAQAAHTLLHTAELAFRIPAPAKSRWYRAGLSPRTEKIMDIAGGVLLALFTTGWTWSLAAEGARADRARGISPVVSSIASALTDGSAPSAAFLTEAAISAFSPVRGRSGRLRAQIQEPGERIIPDSLPPGARLEFSSGAAAESAATAVAPRSPGIWNVAIRVGSAIKPLADFNVITLRPFSEKRSGRIGLYYMGIWPNERGRRGGRNAPPRGFIEVTSQNQHTFVSNHFLLGDFLTHDQTSVWPKYLVLDTKLIDKLELVLGDLEGQGLSVRGVKIMSGFRTPQYNQGGGDPRGRAALSRHMYGDAADIFIDNDGNGRMDDLNGDGRINVRDARVIQAAVDRVEVAHPTLVGGCGVYVATGAHGPFTHIDTRGYRARWIGTGDN